MTDSVERAENKVRTGALAAILRGLKVYAPDEIKAYGRDEADTIADYVVPYIIAYTETAVKDLRAQIEGWRECAETYDKKCISLQADVEYLTKKMDVSLKRGDTDAETISRLNVQNIDLREKLELSEQIAADYRNELDALRAYRSTVVPPGSSADSGVSPSLRPESPTCY